MGGDGLCWPYQGRKVNGVLLLHSSSGPLLSDFLGEGGFFSGEFWSEFVLGGEGSSVELVTWLVAALEVCKLDTFYELFCFASLVAVFWAVFCRRRAFLATALGWGLYMVQVEVYWRRRCGRRRLGMAGWRGGRWQLSAIKMVR